jgi:hypothetical protein
MRKGAVLKLLLFLLLFPIFASQAQGFGEPSNRSRLILGIARHDENMKEYLKPGTNLPERKDLYGRPIAIRTFFTSIFEPWGNTGRFIKKINRYGQLPSLTLEFRSWAQILKDAAKIDAEKNRIDKQFGKGYYDRLMKYVNNETVLEGVVCGDFDPILKTIAENLAPAGPVNLRLFHEPFWFPWKMRGPRDAYKFVGAVKHVRRVLQQNGAANISIVITFDISGFDVEGPILLAEGFVDVIEIDGYNDAWRRSLWKKDPDVQAMFGPKVESINKILASLPAGKKRPLFIIGETAFDGTGRFSKKRMYLDLIEFVKYNHMDGIVFLDENDGPLTEGGWHVDWAIDKDLARELWGKL